MDAHLSSTPAVNRHFVHNFTSILIFYETENLVSSYLRVPLHHCSFIRKRYIGSWLCNKENFLSAFTFFNYSITSLLEKNANNQITIWHQQNNSFWNQEILPKTHIFEMIRNLSQHLILDNAILYLVVWNKSQNICVAWICHADSSKTKATFLSCNFISELQVPQRIIMHHLPFQSHSINMCCITQYRYHKMYYTKLTPVISTLLWKHL